MCIRTEQCCRKALDEENDDDDADDDGAELVQLAASTRKRLLRQPRFASEFPVPLRKRFLCRIYIIFSATLLVWLLLVQWATSDHLSPATWMDAEESLRDDWAAVTSGNGGLPRLEGHPIVAIVSAAVLLLVLLVVFVAPHVTAAWFPLNLLVWALFTLSSGYLLASMASNYSRAMVVYAIGMLLLIAIPWAIYCALPCTGDFWHPVAFLWVLVVVLGVGLAVMLPHSNQYVANWGWLEHRPVWTAPRHMYDAGVVWLTLAVVVFAGALLIWYARQTERCMEPDDWFVGGILLAMYLGLVFALSLQFVSSACQTSFSWCVRPNGTCRCQ